jgi:outer membrane receptor protein involved in Fe transport
MRYTFIVLAVFLDSFLNITFAQGIIEGKVFDNNTHELLRAVYVIYKNQGTITDQSGTFLISSDTGKVNITFRFIGYKPVTKTINLSSGDTIKLNIGLETDVLEIGQIVISANKTEQRVAELTVSMDVLKSKDFLNTHITDAKELITKTPGIEVMDGQASIRGGSGFSYGAGSRVLALVDGLPIISPDAGNIKWEFLPLENISQIEIIKGASSVLYGSSALNGVINFRTADATNTPVTKFFAETGIYGKPADRNWIWTHSPLTFSDISFSHLQKFGNTDIGLGINLLNDDGYRKYNNEQLARVSLRLKHHNSNVRGLSYGLNINSGYTAKRDFILWENAETGALIQDTSTVSLLHGSFIDIDPYISFDNEGPFKHDLRIRFQSANNRFPARNDKNSDALSLFTEYQLNYSLSDIITIISGIAESYDKILSNFYGDHQETNVAGFAQMEASPVPRLKLVAGVRLEQNFLDGEPDKIVPVFRTGINWKAAGLTFIRGSFGQGYRYPSIAEKFASTTLGSIKIFPNPYVKPESGWNSEIGIKQAIIMGKTTGTADLSFFFSQNKDMIEFLFGSYPDQVTGNYDFGFQAANIEQSRVYGYELEFLVNRSIAGFNTTLSGGYTYMYPVQYNQVTQKNTDIYLKYRRKHSLKISLGSSFKKIDAGLDVFVKSKILNIDDVFLNELTRESILPGFYDYWLHDNKPYMVLDGNIGYQVSKILNLSLAVKNITNTEYMGRPGDIQPQRNYSLRLSGAF